MAKRGKRGNNSLSFFKISKVFVATIIFVFFFKSVLSSDWSTEQDVSAKHATLSYTWFLHGEDETLPDEEIAQIPLTISGEINWSQKITIFDEAYDLCEQHGLLCSYMLENSDHLSDYYLFFQLDDELHWPVQTSIFVLY